MGKGASRRHRIWLRRRDCVRDAGRPRGALCGVLARRIGHARHGRRSAPPRRKNPPPCSAPRSSLSTSAATRTWSPSWRTRSSLPLSPDAYDRRGATLRRPPFAYAARGAAVTVRLARFSTTPADQPCRRGRAPRQTTASGNRRRQRVSTMSFRRKICSTAPGRARVALVALSSLTTPSTGPVRVTIRVVSNPGRIRSDGKASGE